MLPGMERYISPLLVLFTGFSAAASDTVARPRWQEHFDARRAAAQLDQILRAACGMK